MKTHITHHRLAVFHLCLLQSAFCLLAWAQPTAFTYQGELSDSGSPANGIYDLRFAVYDAETNGTSIGMVTNAATEVGEGLFTVTLDFGVSVFDGDDRWLEIGAVTNGGGLFSTLTPRQRITSAPYAIQSATATTAASAMTATSATSATSADTALSAPWSGLTGVPAGFADGVDDDTTYSAGPGLNLGGTEFSLDSSYTDGRYWKQGGNAGTTGGTDFLGTTDNQPLELHVNNQRALRLESTSGTPNLIGGYSGNSVGIGTYGAVIAGGGSLGGLNIIGTNSNFSTIGGGEDNTASHLYATVGGGKDNTASGHFSTIPGGSLNNAALYAFAAGRRAKAEHTGAFVWADSTDADFVSTADDQLLIRASGGVGIGTNNPQSELHVAGTVTATSFSGDGAGLTGLSNPEGFYKPTRVYTAVIGLNSGGSAPSGFEEVGIESILGTNSPPPNVQILLTSDNLVIGSANSWSYQGTYSTARINNGGGTTALAIKDYTTYGQAHAVILYFNTDNPALAPTGYTYISTDDLRDSSGYAYLMTGPGGFYLGGHSYWSDSGVDNGPGLQRISLGTNVGGVAFRVYGVEEDAVSSAGIFPFFIGGSSNLTNELGSAWLELSLSELAAGGLSYLSWTDSATYVGFVGGGYFAGGNYASVTLRETDIDRLFLRVLSGEGQISPQMRFLGDVTPPAGWLALDAADLKGAIGHGYYQATGYGAYLGGLYSWNRKDDLNGCAALTFSSYPSKIAVQVAP